MSKRHPFVPVPGTIRKFGEGEPCLDAVAGDLVLVRHAGFVAKAIRAAERLRTPREYCWTNHACIVMRGGVGALVSQETAKGDVLSSLADLAPVRFVVVHPQASLAQRGECTAFAKWAVGTGYGYLQIVADLFNAVTGLELGLGIGNRMVCSTQATRALERVGLIPGRSSAAVTPAELARYFGAAW